MSQLPLVLCNFSLCESTDLLQLPHRRLNRLDNLRRTANRNRIIRHALRHHTSCPNCTPLPNHDPQQNHNIPANPTIITNRNLARKFNVVLSRLHFCLVRRGIDADKGPEHDSVADSDESAVENHHADEKVRKRVSTEIDIRRKTGQ